MLDREYVREHRTLGYVIGRMEFNGEPHAVVQPQDGPITLVNERRLMPVTHEYAQRDAQIQLESVIGGMRAFGLEDTDIITAFLHALAGYRAPKPTDVPRVITHENAG